MLRMPHQAANLVPITRTRRLGGTYPCMFPPLLVAAMRDSCSRVLRSSCLRKAFDLARRYCVLHCARPIESAACTVPELRRSSHHGRTAPHFARLRIRRKLRRSNTQSRAHGSLGSFLSPWLIVRNARPRDLAGLQNDVLRMAHLVQSGQRYAHIETRRDRCDHARAGERIRTTRSSAGTATPHRTGDHTRARDGVTGAVTHAVRSAHRGASRG